MVRRCFIFSCGLSERTSGPSDSFHRLPRDGAQMAAWKTVLQEVGETLPTPGPRVYICSRHFRVNDFLLTGKGRQLRSSAVPSAVPHKHDHDDNILPDLKKTSVNAPCPDPDQQNSSNSFNSSFGSYYDSDPAFQATLSSQATPSPITNRKPIRYPGDVTESDFQTPDRAKKAFEVTDRKLTEMRSKKELLEHENIRYRTRIESLEADLRQAQQQLSQMQLNVQVVDKCKPKVVQRLATNTKTGKSYCEEIRLFAMGLNYHSPAAYEFAKGQLSTGTDLPSKATIAQWYQVVDCGPGISTTAMNIVRTKVNESAANGKKLFANLVMDEMSIRKQLFTEKDGTLGGTVDVGFDVGTKHELATEALMFLVTAINEHFRVAVSHHFTAGLNAEKKNVIISQVLMALHDQQVAIPSITFDGTKTNLRCMELLGAVLKENNTKTTFPHPSGVGTVCVVMDAVHMIKLVRNTFASKRVFFDDRGRKVDFSFIEKLEELQRHKGLRLGNKLMRAHVDFAKSKMKTKLAVQVFSNSVADALEYLLEHQVEEFQNSRATIEFLRLFNNLFDIMNSKSKFGKEFQRPYCRETHPEFYQYMQYCRKYITQLAFMDNGDKKYLLDSQNHTGFLGFIVNIETINVLFFEYIFPARGPLDYLLTFKLSQDHIEQTFCLVRARGGFNDNPTTKQFSYAFRALLVNRQLTISKGANSSPQDGTEFAIFSVSSAKKLDTQQNDDDMETVIEDWLFDDLQLEVLDAIDIDIVRYIAGYVERKLERSIRCKECLIGIYTDELDVSALIEYKRHGNGGLHTPRRDVVSACKIAEQMLRCERENIENGLTQPLKLHNKIVALVFEQHPEIFAALDEHVTSCPAMENHKLLLTKLIVRFYLTIRSHHMCRLITEASKKANIRHFSKKMVIFAGQ